LNLPVLTPFSAASVSPSTTSSSIGVFSDSTNSVAKALICFLLHLLGGYHLRPCDTQQSDPPLGMSGTYFHPPALWHLHSWTSAFGKSGRGHSRSPVTFFVIVSKLSVGAFGLVYLVPYVSKVSRLSSAMSRMLRHWVVGRTAVCRKHLFILFTLTTISLVLDNFTK
jgi:hypothetical protein